MLGWAISKLKAAIQFTISEEDSLSKDHLSTDDWNLLTSIRDILKAFYDATQATEPRKSTIDLTIPTLDFLVEQFDQAIEQFNHHDILRESLQAGLTKLLEYWNKTQLSPVYIAAIVLDPRNKLEYFRSWEPEWVPEMRQRLRRSWESTYRSSTGLPQRPSTSHKSTDNEFFKWRESKRQDVYNDIDELDHYLGLGPVPLDDEIAAIDWWISSDQQKKYPLLSKMAIDIYSIPPMSAEPERVFSQTKLIITDLRNRLQMDAIEVLQCLKSWFRIGIYTDEELHEIMKQSNQK